MLRRVKLKERVIVVEWYLERRQLKRRTKRKYPSSPVLMNISVPTVPALLNARATQGIDKTSALFVVCPIPGDFLRVKA